MKDILFLGDFLYDYDHINDDILELSKYIKENDLITILNFEGAFKSENKLKKPINLYCTKESIEVLKLLNVVAVNLANNHVMDYGEEGLKLLIDALDEAGIGHFGAGMNLEESLKPFILEFPKRKIYFYGFGWDNEECINAKKNEAGTAPLDYDLMKKIIYKRDCFFNVFCCHFGYEYEKLPQPYDFKKCREVASFKDVKIIIGHHPHVVQAYDKQSNIFYSLGNFYFGSMRKKYDEKHKYYPNVNQGIGVIMEPMYWKTKIIKLMTKDEITKIDNDIEIENFTSISKVTIKDYPKYFKKHNNTINKRYVYGISKFHEKFWNKTHYMRRNIYKFYLRKIKWPFGKKVKSVFRLVKGCKNEK